MKQNGNALFLILIAVALFAALSYAVTQSGRGGGNIDREELELALAQQVSYFNSVRAAVQKLSILGYTAVEIETAVSPSIYTVCTSGEACVFAPEGGGAVFQEPVSSLSPNAFFHVEYNDIDESDSISGFGSASDDIMMELPGVTEAACTAYNDKFGIANPPVQDVAALDGVISSYPGEETACYETQFNSYSIYFGLLAQ